ncbi:MAG TPA: hypothetical protein VNZ55_06575, partial [Thermomicrobiales bacterium]|nr:hypothetical protein [Thermomicrobiales bacterium]
MSDLRLRRQTTSPPAPTKRRREVSRISLAGGALHVFGALAMVLGLLLPLTGAGQALAAPTSIDSLSREPSQDIDSAAFTQVAAIGDFQGQFGCNGFDINCPSTQLTNHNGLWTGVFAIPAGQWQWQIAAMTQDGQQITLSDRGNDQTGSLSIGDEDAGAWFFFSASRQEADAAATDQLATLSTDIGTFALEPDNGDYTAILQSQGGAINAELQLGGSPVGNPQML